jgi:uncharacterized protein YceH (UPF0502 family)
MVLDEVAGRVLGCLLEKELATPQQYPLTANAVLLAANQTSNRDPVMTLSEGAVLEALDRLKEERFVRFVFPSHGRSVVRYRQVLDEHLGLDAPQRAVLAVLLLRGPQTPGELRSRTERLVGFDEIAEVEVNLRALAARAEPLVRQLERQPGHKEQRWQQLLAETPGAGPGRLAGAERRADPPPQEAAPDHRPDPAPAPPTRDLGPVPLGGAELGAEVAALRAEVAALRRDLDELRRALGA